MTKSLVFINTIHGNKHRYTVDNAKSIETAYRDDTKEKLIIECVETGMKGIYPKINIDNIQMQAIKDATD